MIKHALLVDNSVQWFAYIVTLEGLEDEEEVDPLYEVLEGIPLNSEIETDNDFIKNIYNRPATINNIKVNLPGQCLMNFSGFHLSDKEYARIKRMIEIYPIVREFKDLRKYY